MPSLLSKLGETLRREGDLYEVSLDIAKGANRGEVAIKTSHLAIYPVEDFTPGSTLGLAPLTDTNLQESIDNARLQAIADGGGRVVIPIGIHSDTTYGSGHWQIPAGIPIPAGSLIAGKKAAIRFAAGGPSIFLEGVPGTQLVIPADCDVGVYFHSPKIDESDVHVHIGGGMNDLTIRAHDDAVQTTEGLRINGAVNCTFEDLTILGFNGASGGNYGTALRTIDDWDGGGGNCQMCRFENLWCLTNQITFRTADITTSYARGMNSQGAIHRAWLVENGAELHVHSSGIQETLPDVFVEIDGGGYMRFEGCYHEGGDGHSTFFKVSNPTSYAALVVERLRIGAPIALFADVTDFGRLVVNECVLLANATKYLRALPTANAGGANAPIVFSNNSIDVADASNSAKFETNAYSLPMLTVIEGGGVFHGGKSTHGGPVKLAAYAEGSEPASPLESDLIWNSTTKRPRVRGASAHHDVALVDDPKGLTGLIKSYAAEILDPAVYKKRSVISGGLDTITGLLHGSTAPAPSSGRRPDWLDSDPAFGGQPSFTCVNTSDKMLTLTLGGAAQVPTGSYPGAIMICRAIGAIPSTHRRRLFTTNVLSMGALDGDDGTQWQAYYNGYTSADVGGVFQDNNPHAVLVQVEPFVRVRIDAVDGSAIAVDQGVSTAAISTVYVGAFSDVASNNAADLAIAYYALLKEPLPPSVQVQFWDLANTIYKLGL